MLSPSTVALGTVALASACVALLTAWLCLHGLLRMLSSEIRKVNVLRLKAVKGVPPVSFPLDSVSLQ